MVRLSLPLRAILVAAVVAAPPLAALAEDGMGAVRSPATAQLTYGAQSRGLGIVDSNSSQLGRDGADALPGAITVTQDNMQQRRATTLASALRVVPGVLAIGR